ncbi:hypothetical protein Elgi_00590 [Paenibacillus elgii]|uniref:hypothetical protein n=1 Tax=Paenibacillus elgii TaxID=189691 RepID=UPI002D7D2524|nr:hypothetical protein Elgi_00590 [Paenibacillus elgii]
MKEAIVVDLNGFLTDVTLVTDDVTGVFPMFKPHRITESTEELQQSSPEIIGYIIAIAVPSGLYKPKFDFNAWELYNKLSKSEIDGKDNLLTDEDGDSIFEKPKELNLWIEGESVGEADITYIQSKQSIGKEQFKSLTEKMKNKQQQLISGYKRFLNK